LLNTGSQEWISANEESTSSHLDDVGEGSVNILFGTSIQDSDFFPELLSRLRLEARSRLGR